MFWRRGFRAWDIANNLAVLLAERSRPVRDVLFPMMKESDNLYAEALFYRLAAHSGKPYASRKESWHYIERLIGQMGYDPEKYLESLEGKVRYVLQINPLDREFSEALAHLNNIRISGLG